MALNTKMQQAVVEAMRQAGVKPSDPVMLTGHGQGGITAAALASDPTTPFRVTSVVTAGSPIGRFHIPDRVSVLSMEQRQEIVPQRDGSPNPDRSNWVTVSSDLDGGDAAPSEHDLARRAKNETFFTDGSAGSARRYQISPIVGGGGGRSPQEYSPVPDARLYQMISHIGGVVDVSIKYSDSFENSNSYAGEITVADESQSPRVLDRALAILWMGHRGAGLVIAVGTARGVQTLPGDLNLFSRRDFVRRYGEQPGTGSPPAMPLPSRSP